MALFKHLSGAKCICVDCSFFQAKRNASDKAVQKALEDISPSLKGRKSDHKKVCYKWKFLVSSLTKM